tara:strand:- start:203 stop:469 length:267 start_codon:yes stop_codon:yes gene_type:complete
MAYAAHIHQLFQVMAYIRFLLTLAAFSSQAASSLILHTERARPKLIYLIKTYEKLNFYLSDIKLLMPFHPIRFQSFIAGAFNLLLQLF